MILKRIAPLSLAKMFALLYGLMGLLIGALISLLSVVGAFAAAGQNQDGAFAFLFGAGAFIILPIFYAVVGAVGGFLTAFIYNLVARMAGGVEIELEPKPAA